MDLYEMIIKAEKIVYGTIVEVDSLFFTFHIEGSLTGDTGLLKVRRFKDWTCATRWTEYKVDQKLFLFLRTWKGNLTSMSAGNEGELPILNESVFIHGYTIPIAPPPQPPTKEIKSSIFFKPNQIEIYGAMYYGIEWSLSNFIETTAFIRNCYLFEYGEYKVRTNWEVNCSQSEIEKMIVKSELSEWVHQLARKEK